MSSTKSPSYIRKWIKSTEEAGTPFVGQTLIGSEKVLVWRLAEITFGSELWQNYDLLFAGVIEIHK